MNGRASLCAEIVTDTRMFSLCFSVDALQESYLSVGRADAFVMALLPTAMWGGVRNSM